MLSVDGTGSVQIYDGNPEDKHRIVGAVSIHPTLCINDCHYSYYI